MPTIRVLAFSGSLRSASWNSKLVQAALGGARSTGSEVTYIALRDYPLPIYDQEIEDREGLPQNASRLKELFKGHAGFLIGCPEYNSSITGALKNVIDWVSRPVPNEKSLECFTGKVCGLLAASPGALGGQRGLFTVRSILSNIGVIVLPDQFALQKAHEAFGDDGLLKDPGQQKKAAAVAEKVARTAAKLAD